MVVNALVRVTAAEDAYEAGPLTPWHREGQLLREYFDAALDCYELRITDMCQVCEPHGAETRARASMRRLPNNSTHSSARVSSHTHVLLKHISATL